MQKAETKFDYYKAFERTIGWISKEEQEFLRSKHIAIGGLGGTGGYYALTLARLGLEHFSLADNDCFDMNNLNRQAGAFLHTLKKNKAEVLAEMITGINPNISVRIFNRGIDETNISDFLKGVDFYLSSMGLSSVDIQTDIFESCRQKGIPATTVIVPGFGAALINFHPNRMSYDQYFQAKGYSREEQAIRLIVGHNPRLMPRRYILSDDNIRFKEYDGPVNPMACVLAAGLACTNLLKIILGRNRVYWSPWSYQLDAYLGKFVKTWRPGGNSNLLQRVILLYLRKRFQLPKHVKRSS